MIKIKIGKTEVRLLKNGSFKCKDPELLRYVQMVAEDYDAGSAYYLNRELALLRTMLNDAVYNGWLNRSPFLNAKGLVSLADETKRERVLTFEEENRLLQACSEFVTLNYERNGKKITVKAKSNREHLRPIIITVLVLDTAMRCGELLKLRWQDVKLNNRTISILAFNTKTAKARTVGMTQRVYDELAWLWDQSPKESGELVFGVKDTVKRSFASACRDAGIEGFHFHDCRHTAITRMIQAGLSPMEVMKDFRSYSNEHIRKIRQSEHSGSNKTCRCFIGLPSASIFGIGKRIC